MRDGRVRIPFYGEERLENRGCLGVLPEIQQRMDWELSSMILSKYFEQ